MRLMLGIKDRPSLLVEIEQEKSPTEFDFYVVNGAWEGTFYNGNVTIWHPECPWTDLEEMKILTKNQDRLRGGYQDVFDNFDNHEYVAPATKKLEIPASWNDDIPF